MQSLLNRTKTFLTPTSSSANLQDSGKFRTEKQAEALFQRPDPKVDGDDCLHDCASCTESLPRKWSIDEEDKLYGHVNGWQTHLIIGTGKTDWVRDVKDEQGSLMQAVGKLGVELSNGKLMMSASDMSAESDCGSVHDSSGSAKHSDYANEGRTRCIVLPRWEVIENVGINDAKWLLQDVISKGSTNSTPLSKEPAKRSESSEAHAQDRNGETVVQKQPQHEHTPDIEGLTLSPSNQQKPPSNTLAPSANGAPSDTTNTLPSAPIPSSIHVSPLPHRAIILMCSHSTRDWRCGKSAPILRRELERHLRPLGLYRDPTDTRPGGVGIYFINHVGGHKYSANVMVYRRDDASGEAVQGIWLARVRPEDCENIVRYTVLQGKVVKPGTQLRGGFDRERGVLSW